MRRVIDTRRMRRLRKERDLTQGDLASRCGVAVNTIGRIERGELQPSKELAERMSKALRTNQANLYCEVEDAVPPEGMDDDELAAVSAYRRLDPIQRAAVRGFIEGLAESGSLDSALVAAKAALAIERSRQPGGRQEEGPVRRTGA